MMQTIKAKNEISDPPRIMCHVFTVSITFKLLIQLEMVAVLLQQPNAQ